jgi:hypothetical protein
MISFSSPRLVRRTRCSPAIALTDFPERYRFGAVVTAETEPQFLASLDDAIAHLSEFAKNRVGISRGRRFAPACTRLEKT